VSKSFRVGLLVPSSNTTMETELPAILNSRQEVRPGERFTFHASRMRMQHVTPEELRAMNAQTGRAVAELADVRPDVVASACLVAIMAQGPRHHRVAEAEIADLLAQADAAAPVISSAGALIAALEALGARRIAIVTPYMKPLTKLVADYIEDTGVEVCYALSLVVSDNRAVARLNPSDLVGHHRRLKLHDCDAVVLSACVQMPSLPAIGVVERECGLPTLSAATATAWSVLTALQLEPVAPRAGRLLGQEARAIA